MQLARSDVQISGRSVLFVCYSTIKIKLRVCEDCVTASPWFHRSAPMLVALEMTAGCASGDAGTATASPAGHGGGCFYFAANDWKR